MAEATMEREEAMVIVEGGCGKAEKMVLPRGEEEGGNLLARREGKIYLSM